MRRVRRNFRICVGSADGLEKGCLSKSKTGETEMLPWTESYLVAGEAHRWAGGCQEDRREESTV
jgi:hypothetical protein